MNAPILKALRINPSCLHGEMLLSHLRSVIRVAFLVVLVATLTGRHGPLLDALSVAVLAARICQTMVHVSFVETERAVTYRFSLFTVQLLAMLWMVGLIVGKSLSN